jgi:intracellular septation protein
VGLVMLRPGWLLRYLPATPRSVAPDVIVAVGYCWAALMFVTAAVNALAAIAYSVPIWATAMLIFGVVSKLALFIAGFLVIRLTTARRVRKGSYSVATVFSDTAGEPVSPVVPTM